MITIIDGVFNQAVPSGQIIAMVAISVAITLAFYVLRSIGLFVMARRAKLAHAFIAWIPLIWMVTAVKLIKKVNFFGKPMEKLAWIFCIIFSVSSILNLVYEGFIYFPLVGNFLMGREISVLMATGTAAEIAELTKGLTPYWGMVDTIYCGADFVNPYGDAIYSIINFLNVIGYVSIPFEIATIVIQVTIYVNLFKRYLPQHYMLAMILSVLGLFAPFVFAVRKREPINYLDYLRMRYQSFGAYGPYGGNPYGQNPYGANPNGQGAPKQPEHPFSEFADKKEVDPGDPFKEFSNDKKDE